MKAPRAWIVLGMEYRKEVHMTRSSDAEAKRAVRSKREKDGNHLTFPSYGAEHSSKDQTKRSSG